MAKKKNALTMAATIAIAFGVCVLLWLTATSGQNFRAIVLFISF